MSSLREKLLATFQIEHGEHLERIRAILAGFEPGRGGIGEEGLEEVFRRAHSLKGAARVVDLRPVEILAHRLEALFARIRKGELEVDRAVVDLVHPVLDATEDCVAALAEGRDPGDTTEVLAAIDAMLGHATEPVAEVRDRATSPPPTPIRAAESVRVRMDALERVSRGAGRLLAENFRQGGFADELDGLLRQVTEAQTGCERGEIEPLERQLRRLSRDLVRLQSRRRRGAWMLRQLGEQLQREIDRSRTVPADSVFAPFHRMVRHLARDAGKEIEFRLTGGAMEADRAVLQALKDPIMHLLRNAVGHGIELPEERRRAGKPSRGSIALRIDAEGWRLAVTVEDDGRGLDVEAIRGEAVRRGLLAAAAHPSADELGRLILHPSFSTARDVSLLSGRGMGLTIAHEAVTRLQGDLEVRSRAGSGTGIVLSVPLTVTSGHLLLVECQGQTFAVPTRGVERLHRIRAQEIATVEGRLTVRIAGDPVHLTSLARLLDLGDAAVRSEGETVPVMVLRSASRRLAVAVDGFLDQCSTPILGLGPCDRIHPGIAGGILLEDGRVCLVLRPSALVEDRAVQTDGSLRLVPAAPEDEPVPTILVVDDSITTRTLEKSILEANGYRVQVAVDGSQALTLLLQEKVDLVVTDIQMPGLNGLDLLAAMKKHQRLARLPTVLVTSMASRQDKEAGLNLGADAYIVKQKFDQRELLDTIRRLL